jgi:hypothetical protein
MYVGFFLLMPYWLVCIIHVENRFRNTFRCNYLSEHHNHHHANYDNINNVARWESTWDGIHYSMISRIDQS